MNALLLSSEGYRITGSSDYLQAVGGLAARSARLKDRDIVLSSRPISREVMYRAFDSVTEARGTASKNIWRNEVVTPEYPPDSSTLFANLHKVGLEIEGGWRYSPPDEVFPDGSVNDRLGPYVGEVRTLDFVNEIDWPHVANVWPDKVDSSCGLHAHISFAEHDNGVGLYDSVVCREFQPWFLDGLRLWGKGKGAITSKRFYDRLDGRNTYCKNRYDMDLYLPGNGDRYVAVNYCWHKDETIEIRVLPAFINFATAKAAINYSLTLVDLWVSANADREVASCV